MDIHDACENGNLEFLISVLTCKDPSVTVYTKDEHGRTPLHAACFAAQYSVVKLLFGMNVTYRPSIKQQTAEGDKNDGKEEGQQGDGDNVCVVDFLQSGMRSVLGAETVEYSLPPSLAIDASSFKGEKSKN